MKSDKLADMIANDIRHAIITGALKASDRLPAEPDMMKQYGVSRGVIRESLRLLEADNMVEVRRGPKGGAIIKPRNNDSIDRATLLTMRLHHSTVGDVYETVKVLVPAAARLAGNRAQPEVVRALRAHIAKIRTARIENEEQLAQLLSEFNYLIIEYSGLVPLQIIGQSLHRIVGAQFRRLHWAFKPQVGDAAYDDFIEFSVANAEKLIALIEAGEGDQAEIHWRAHMEKAGEIFFGAVDCQTILE